MKIKQEASGWPAECDTEQNKMDYLDDCRKSDVSRVTSQRKTKGGL